MTNGKSRITLRTFIRTHRLVEQCRYKHTRTDFFFPLSECTLFMHTHSSIFSTYFTKSKLFFYFLVCLCSTQQVSFPFLLCVFLANSKVVQSLAKNRANSLSQVTLPSIFTNIILSIISLCFVHDYVLFYA